MSLDRLPRATLIVLVSALCTVFASSGQSYPHYRKLLIPGPFRFPTPESELLKMRDDQDVAAMRNHAWNLFAGLTNAEGPMARRPPRWDTWFTKCDVKLSICLPPSPKTSNQERLMRAFAIPAQNVFTANLNANLLRSNSASYHTELENALLSFLKEDPQFASVLFNQPARDFVLGNGLYSKSVLDQMLSDRLKANAVEGEREIAPFPRDAVVLKTAWELVTAQTDGKAQLWVWNPEMEKEEQFEPGIAIPRAKGWNKSVTIDTTKRGCRDGDYADDEPIPIDCFYSFPINAAVPYWDQLVNEINNMGVPTPGSRSYMVLMAVHVATKEITDWVWATFWWFNQSSNRDYGWDRPPSSILKGNKWRHFLMDTTLSGNTPLASDFGNKICYNRYLEEKQPNGMVSNCIGCHVRAVYSHNANLGRCGYALGHTQRCTETQLGSLPKCLDIIHTECTGVEDYYQSAIKTDFLWSIPGNQDSEAEHVQEAFVDLLEKRLAKH